MAKVTYISADGVAKTVELTTGTSVMRGAKDFGIEGIEADCGGAAACATCHVYVDEAWMDKVGSPNADEQ